MYNLYGVKFHHWNVRRLAIKRGEQKPASCKTQRSKAHTHTHAMSQKGSLHKHPPSKVAAEDIIQLAGKGWSRVMRCSVVVGRNDDVYEYNKFIVDEVVGNIDFGPDAKDIVCEEGTSVGVFRTGRFADRNSLLVVHFKDSCKLPANLVEKIRETARSLMESKANPPGTSRTMVRPTVILLQPVRSTTKKIRDRRDPLGGLHAFLKGDFFYADPGCKIRSSFGTSGVKLAS